MSVYMTLEEYAATLKVGDEVTIKYYSITGEKEIKEKILKITNNFVCYKTNNILRRIIMLYRFIFKILKELAETQQDLEITRSSNMTILTLLLEKKICSKEEYVSTFNEIQSKNMENINQIKNKIHEIEEQIKQYEQQMRKKG